MLSMPATDTSPAAHELQLRLYREAGPQRRAEMAAELSDLIRVACRAGVRLRHPHFSEAETTREMLRIFYGGSGRYRP
jgi:hypothetical protein